MVRSESQVTASTNLMSELNGVSDRVTVTDGVVEQEPQEGVPSVVELEAPEAAQAEAEGAPSLASVVLSATPSPSPTPPPSPPLSAPAAAVTTTSPSPPPLPLPGALPALQGDLEGEEITRTILSEDEPEALVGEELEAESHPEENAESNEGLNVRKGHGPGECSLCRRLQGGSAAARSARKWGDVRDISVLYHF